MSVVFYALRDEIVKKHPTQALSDIPIGKDISNVGWQMLAWVVRDCNPIASPSTQEVLDILDAMGRGEAVCQKRREAATDAASDAIDAAGYASWAASDASYAARAASAAASAASSWAATYATSAASDAASSWAATYAASAASSWAATYATSAASDAASASDNFWKRASRKLLELYVLY